MDDDAPDQNGNEEVLCVLFVMGERTFGCGALDIVVRNI